MGEHQRIGRNKWLFPDVGGIENLTAGPNSEVVSAIRESSRVPRTSRDADLAACTGALARHGARRAPKAPVAACAIRSEISFSDRGPKVATDLTPRK